MFDPQTPFSSQLEWGPAHLRDEVTHPVVEPADRPDDN